MHFSASSQLSKICFGYQGIIFNGKKVVKVFSKNSHRNFIKRGGGGSKAVYKLYKKQEKWKRMASLTQEC